jgi:GNAT superfamily N-acetyltransferase
MMSARIPPIRLDDGATLDVRAIEPEDICRLERMFHRLSPTTVYRRFFSPIRRPSHRMLLWLTNVDHDRREALIALHDDEIVAVARYDGRPGATDAEIAVTVEDAWQHRGVGKRLARRLAVQALDHGFERFIATMLADNREALGLLRRLSSDASVRFVDGSYAAVAPLSRAS